MTPKARFVERVWVVMTGFFLVSCASAPVKMYTGQDLPADKTATIETVNSLTRQVRIEICDGTKLTPSRTRIVVLPERITIGLGFMEQAAGGNGRYSTTNCFHYI